MFKDKRGLIFKNAFFAVIVVSIIIIASGVWIDDWNTKYDSGLTYDLQDYDKLDEFTNEASNQEGNISASSSFSNIDFEGTSIRSAFSFISNIFKPFRVVFGDGGMLDSVKERFSIPDYIMQGVVTLMIISITWAVIAILFRRVRSTT